jgi:hypothetical protein
MAEITEATLVAAAIAKAGWYGSEHRNLLLQNLQGIPLLITSIGKTRTIHIG